MSSATSVSDGGSSPELDASLLVPSPLLLAAAACVLLPLPG